MKSHELEQARRSLAMSPSLTPAVARQVVDAIGKVIEDKRSLSAAAEELERLAQALRDLAR